MFDEDYQYHCWDDWELGCRLWAMGMKSKLIQGAVATHQHALTLEGRLSAVEQSGKSCRLYEQKNLTSERPWRANVNKNMLMLNFKANVLRWFYSISKSDKLLNLFYMTKIDLAFNNGYHNRKTSEKIVHY